VPEVAIVAQAEVAPLLEAMRADGLDVIPGEGTWIGARDAGGSLAGVARIFDRDGIAALDDVWVAPAHRRAGVGSALVAHARTMRRPLWLIADEIDVGFYAARGFATEADTALPAGLAAHYASKDEWPAPDHRHVAMRAI